MQNNILPLGSVVTLKDGDGTELMIITRGAIVEENNQEEYFDYGSVIIPQGMVTPEQVYFFNRENVDKVIFSGYINADEKEFEMNYDSYIRQSGLTKARVD